MCYFSEDWTVENSKRRVEEILVEGEFKERLKKITDKHL